MNKWYDDTGNLTQARMHASLNLANPCNLIQGLSYIICHCGCLKGCHNLWEGLQPCYNSLIGKRATGVALLITFLYGIVTWN